MKKSTFLLGATSFLMMMAAPALQAQGCCCTDCICPAGPQGAVGPQGVQGPAGVTGTQGPAGVAGPAGTQGIQGPAGTAGAQGSQGPAGVAGPQGLLGPTGPQGIQGLTGPQGPCCAITGTYTSVYSLLNQTLATGDSSTFEMVAATTASFDLSMAGTTGVITVLQSGVYLIDWGVDGITANFPFPVPSWGLGIYQNGVLVPGSTSGSTSISPDDIVTQCNSVFVITLTAGDTLQLKSISTTTLSLLANPPGLVAPLASARLNLVLLTAL